jgi:predicted nucleic acid-binding protein
LSHQCGGSLCGLRPQEEQNTKTFLRSLDLYPLNWPIAELAGTIKRDYGKNGVTLSLTDCLIAAVAIHGQLSLITDNTKDFPSKDLLLYPRPN